MICSRGTKLRLRALPSNGGLGTKSGFDFIDAKLILFRHYIKEQSIHILLPTVNVVRANPFIQIANPLLFHTNAMRQIRRFSANAIKSDKPFRSFRFQKDLIITLYAQTASMHKYTYSR